MIDSYLICYSHYGNSDGAQHGIAAIGGSLRHYKLLYADCSNTRNVVCYARPTFLMMKHFLYFLFPVTAFTSCNDTSKKAGMPKKDSSATIMLDTSITNSFTYLQEQNYLKRKKLLSKRLALYDIENDTADFELRMWLFPSIWDPSILYILKAKDTSWTLFHYQYYTLRSTGNHDYYDSPNIDSVIMESVRPQKTSWPVYIGNLQLDSLWSLQTESSIKGKSFGAVDGHRYLLEFSKKGKYKYLFYTTPEHFQRYDSNHKRFVDFNMRLIDPIIFRGMRNP